MGRERSKLSERFRRVVGAIVIMFDVMPVESLANLQQMTRRNVSITLSSLHSVLSVPTIKTEPVKIFHPSFRDFLSDKERCLSNDLWIDTGTMHARVLQDCLFLISHLREDMCDLPAPGTLISEGSQNIF